MLLQLHDPARYIDRPAIGTHAADVGMAGERDPGRLDVTVPARRAEHRVDRVAPAPELRFVDEVDRAEPHFIGQAREQLDGCRLDIQLAGSDRECDLPFVVAVDPDDIPILEQPGTAIRLIDQVEEVTEESDRLDVEVGAEFERPFERAPFPVDIGEDADSFAKFPARAGRPCIQSPTPSSASVSSLSTGVTLAWDRRGSKRRSAVAC